MLKVASTSTPEHEAILGAALQCMSRCGLRHTSMEQIAREAGLARTTLRRHFKDKEQLTRALLVRLNEQALTAAKHSARSEAAFATRLEYVLGSKAGTFLVMARSANHASELLEEDRRLGRDLSSVYRKKHLLVLRRVLETAAQQEKLAFAELGTTARDVAELLFDFCNGSESTLKPTSTKARRRLRTLTQIVVSGLRQKTEVAGPRRVQA